MLQGLAAAGASPAQAASGLMAVSLAMGLTGLGLSLATRLPIAVAWSTPGAALLAASPAVPGDWPAAVGAFVVSGGLLALAGAWRPLGRLVAAIPASLASATLAGVLLGLCLAPVRALREAPLGAALVIGTWLLMGRFAKLYATPAAVLVAVAVIAAGAPASAVSAGNFLPAPVLTEPVFTFPALAGVALPLFVVTMASQNLPGLAVLRLHGYAPRPGPLLGATGLASVLAAPFGSHAVNLAAITAALVAGPDAGPDPRRRWIAAVANGAAQTLFGLAAGAAAAGFAASAPVLVEAVAGLALLGSFGAALLGALGAEGEREAALITFLVAASGVSALGIGARSGASSPGAPCWRWEGSGAGADAKGTVPAGLPPPPPARPLPLARRTR